VRIKVGEQTRRWVVCTLFDRTGSWLR